MHLDHEHEHSVHTHTHTHADGTQHTHPHTHTHDGQTEHTHTHDGCAEHTHCEGCGGCAEHTPMQELTALMKYMVSHNASHANELANLAKQLNELGQTAAYEQVMQAVSDFEKGNLRLSTVLAALREPGE